MQNDTGNATELLAAPALAPATALGSDPHDLAGLYLRHRASFTLHARRYMKDQRDADELVQEAFLRLFLALPELETELQALAYCRRTITNLAIDRYRADARRPLLVDLDSAPVDELASDDPGDPVVRAEDAALVRDALGMLPALHRAALVKREIEEKSLAVIADELDVPEDSVKHLLFRARRGLRKLLARTSVAPGVDVERGRSFAGVRSGGAALLVLLALALGSGPDLEAVPVVGVDLPDVIGVTRLVDAVGGAVQDVADRMSPDEGASVRGGAGREQSSSGAAPPAIGREGTTPETAARTQAPAAVPGPADVRPGQPARGTGPARAAVPAENGAAAPVPATAGQPGGAGSRPVPGPGVTGPEQAPVVVGPGTGRSGPRGGPPAGVAPAATDRRADQATREAGRAAKAQAKQVERAARAQADEAERAARDEAERAARAAADAAARDAAERAAAQAKLAEKAAQDQAKLAEKASRDVAKQTQKAAQDQARDAARPPASTTVVPQVVPQ